MRFESNISGGADDAITIARRWVVRLHAGEITQRDLDELARWREQSVQNGHAFALAKAQWKLLKQAAVTFDQETARQRSARARGDLTRRAWLGSALAASLGGVAYLAARPPLELWPSLAEFNADYRTDIGERRQLALDDRISIEMNTRTSVTGLDQDGARGLKLIGGEIAVTADRHGTDFDRPFVVTAGDGRVIATHATFNLRSENGAMSVACLGGSVEIACGVHRTSLSARQRVEFGNDAIGPVTVADGRLVEAWRRGLLVFENRPLAQVVAEINRYRRGRIILAGADVGRLPLDATFRLDRIDDVVPKIAHLFDLRVRSLPGGLVLLG
ncbi:FecR family protein [Tardiphaga sp.]|jgi:transmembrane sensor|uniref:FecR family protein n=1 Tax=Tardiphaga sp. TaxID=1926292 RepID=UPI0037DA05D7